MRRWCLLRNCCKVGTRRHRVSQNFAKCYQNQWVNVTIASWTDTEPRFGAEASHCRIHILRLGRRTWGGRCARALCAEQNQFQSFHGVHAFQEDPALFSEHFQHRRRASASQIRSKHAKLLNHVGACENSCESNSRSPSHVLPPSTRPFSKIEQLCKVTSIVVKRIIFILGEYWLIHWRPLSASDWQVQPWLFRSCRTHKTGALPGGWSDSMVFDGFLYERL